MKLRFAKLEGILLRLLILVGVVFTPLIPVQLGASAQAVSASIRVVRSLYTNEYGVNDPKGLAFSPTSNTFFVLNGSGNVTLVTMGEDNAGTQILSEVQTDALNVAFDKKSDSLFVFKRGKSELVKVKSNGNGLPDASASSNRYAVQAFGVKDAQGIAFVPASGRMFILDAGNSQIVSVAPHVTLGFDATEAIKSNKVQKISLKKLGMGLLKGLAYNPSNGHLYVAEPAQKKLYELTQAGDIVATFDLASLGIKNPSAMTFAPSVDNTDDPNIYDLFLLDDGQASKTGLFSFTSTRQQSSASDAQIVELSLEAPMALPPETTLLPATFVKVIDTTNNPNPPPPPSSNPEWNPTAPDTTGIAYWPSRQSLLIADSEVDEMPIFQGKNVFESTISGTLVSTCTPTSSSNEPTGLAINPNDDPNNDNNPNNDRIYFTNDGANRVYEVSMGTDGTYCTSDDVRTELNLGLAPYNIQDAEDVAYGNNTLFIAGGIDKEVYIISLGNNGKLGGGDDSLVDQFDTATLGFTDLEGLGYNFDSGTLFLVSPPNNERYLGETTITGDLLRAYDLSGSAFIELTHREDVTFAPSSQNPAIKNVYVTDRGVDNNSNPNENDGQVWEISISGPGAPTNTNTLGPSPTPTNTPTRTPTPTFTPTVAPLSNPFLSSFVDDGTVGSVAFGDEDILQFNGTTWSLFFDGSDVAFPTAADVFAFHQVDADTILMSFVANVTLGGVTYTPRDIAQFDATSLGSTTAGTFSMYFNGVDVGLSAAAENIDALEVLPDGKVLISTTGSPTVTGVTGALDEDILAFTPTTLGTNTRGTWTLYFDGSDVGLAETNNEDIDALGVAANGDIYLSTLGLFAVTDVSGDDEDVFVCTPTSLGSVTACTYSSTLFFDGSIWGLANNDLDAFNILGSGTSATATPSNTPGPTNTSTNTPTPTNTATSGPSPTPTNTPTDTPTATATFTPSNTPTATNTSSASDLIFADGFESGSFSAWTSNTNDVGDLSVSGAAALVGGQGMQALIDDVSTIYVTDDSPNAEPRYRARFYFDPNSITMASGDAHFIFKGFMGTATDIVQVELRNSAGAFQIRAKLLNDSGAFVITNWFTITDASHFIELDWRAASAAGANNGGLTFWIDGVQQADLVGVDNDTGRIDRARLGALAGMDAGTSGTYYFDAFESRRLNVIGP